MSKIYDNSGSIAKNDRKQKDSHPDIRGKATIGGVNYWIDGWAKRGEHGPWYSLSFKLREDRDGKADNDSRRPTGDEIPF